MGNRGLADLLIQAGEAPPERRILLRDPIAAFGADAVSALATAMWLGDSKYAAFAVRTICRAGELGARNEALRALRAWVGADLSDFIRADVEAAMRQLGASPLPSRGRRVPIVRTAGEAPELQLTDLVVGACYRRADLHRGGLGGNRQKGISYPSGGSYCLLFSDPSKAHEFGYHDAPIGQDGYRYFGEWDGSPEMSLTGGNRAILERSPELYLFTTAACGKVFRGRYACVRWVREATTRDGREHTAIVFELRRAD